MPVKDKIILCCIVILCGGCATVNSINRNYTSVDYFDGVDRKEAEFIAQKQCLEERWCKGQMNISHPDVRDGYVWHVYFRSKSIPTLDHVYIVHIEKDTGKILRTEFTQEK